MKHLILISWLLWMSSCEMTEDQVVAPMTPQTNENQRSFVDSVNTHFYAIYSADFSNANQVVSEAIEIARENNWVEEEAIAHRNLGVILYLQGDYEKAQPEYLAAYELFESINDLSGMARTCNEMANYYQRQGYFDKALSLWEEAEKKAKQADDQEALGTTYGMKGTYYWRRKMYDQSDQYYLQAYAIRKAQNDSVGLGYLLVDLADMAYRKGDFEQALAYFDQSNEIREAIGDRQGIIDNYKMLGDLMMKEQKLNEAEKYYDRCARESELLGYPDLARKAYDSLASIEVYRGNFQRAYYFKEKAEILKDSLINIQRARVISELQTKYETEKKEQQIELQKAEIAEQEASLRVNLILIISLSLLACALFFIVWLIRSQSEKKAAILQQESQIKLREIEIEAAISSQEKERSRFAKDLHDGFGQMISILNLNLRSLEKGMDPHEVFQRSSKVLEEMYQELKSICFNLMPQTLIKKGIPSAFREFSARINATGQKRVYLDLFGMENRLTDLQEISIYRVTQEWVNNVIKYSDAQNIFIQITSDDSELTLLIEDDGMGFDLQLLQNGQGNGWRNMNSRINLIRGSLEVDTQPKRKGNAFIVNVPMREFDTMQVEYDAA